jgi:hypothetical protein
LNAFTPMAQHREAGSGIGGMAQGWHEMLQLERAAQQPRDERRVLAECQ